MPTQTIKSKSGKVPGSPSSQHGPKKIGEEHYRSLIEMLPMVVWIAETDGTASFCNRYWYEFSGLTVEQTVGQGWAAILHPDDRQPVLESWRHSVATATEHTVEHRFRRAADGEYRWHLAKGLPLKDADGHVVKWIGIAVDIHDRKMAEKELAEKDEQLLLAIEAARLGTWGHSLDGGNLQLSYRSKAIFGLPTEVDLTFTDFLALVHPDDRARLEMALTRITNPNGFPEFEIDYRVIRPKGSVHWITTRGKCIFSGGGARRRPVRVTGTVQDITDKKLAEEALKTSESRLRAILAAEPECVKLMNADSTLCEMNAAGLAMFEADSVEQILGKSVLDLVHKEYRPKLEELTRQVFQGQPGTLEFEITGLKGTHRWLLIHATPLRNKGGAVEALLGITRDITDQKAAKDALRASEAKFRALIENSTDAIVVFDAEFNITYASPATEKIIGYDADEIRGMGAFEFIHPDDRTNAQSVFEKALSSSGLPVKATARIRHKDGAWRVLEGVVTNLLHDPHVRGIVNNYRDITEKMQAEEALRASEDKFRRAFRSSPDAISITTAAQGLYLDVNDAFLRMSGYQREEVIGHTALDIGIWADVADRQRVLEELKQQQRVQALETRFRTKTGEVLYAQFSADTIEIGGTHCLLGITRDITQQVKAAEQLRRSEEQYRSFIDRAPYGIFTATTEGFLLVNPALVKMLGYETAEEMYALDLATQVYEDPRERERVLTTIESYTRKSLAGPPPPQEVTWRRKDGKTISVRLMGRGKLDDQGQLRTEVFVENVTEQKVLSKQLQTAQKMEAIGQLAGGVAHDFNNLLMIIGSRAEMILEKTVQPERVVAQAEEIVRATLGAAAVTRQLLAFSRKQTLQPVVLDLNALLMEMGKMLPRLIGEQIETKIITMPKSGSVRVDPGQFEQVFMNLAINARDAMPNGGQLIIQTSSVELDSDYAAAHPSVTPGPHVLVTVTDTGIGMDAETQTRIFEPFFTTKERGRGTGLGLAMVYGIVRQSGGHITVVSAPGAGASFKIYLPEVAHPPDHEQAEHLLPSPSGSETILFVEDEEALRQVGCEFLRSKGYDVLEAANGAEAIEILKAKGRSVHLLITDMIMPHMSGPELAKQALALQPNMRTIYMSGYSGSALGNGTFQPHETFLQKPFRMTTLATQTRAVLDKSP